MFVIKDHFEYSDACFARIRHPENRDLCICADFSTQPAEYGKGMVRVVMDGMSDGNGKEAVEIAAQSLMHHLLGKLIAASRPMAESIETGILNGLDSEALGQQLKDRIFGIIQAAFNAADNALRSSSYDKPNCTISVAVVFYRYLFTANMGDSPIYLLDLSAKASDLIPMFQCHNVAGESVAVGTMTEEEALHSRAASLLRVFLGCREYSLVGYTHFAMTELPQRSILLLGSDGALAQLTKKTMASTLSAHYADGLESAHEELQRLVEESGSVDDYTLVMDLIETD